MRLFFKTQERLTVARRMLDGFEWNVCSSTGFAFLETCQAWLRRVECWSENVRRDLEGDSVPAPGAAGGRWLLHPTSDMVLDPKSGAIS